MLGGRGSGSFYPTRGRGKGTGKGRGRSKGHGKTRGYDGDGSIGVRPQKKAKAAPASASQLSSNTLDAELTATYPAMVVQEIREAAKAAETKLQKRLATQEALTANKAELDALETDLKWPKSLGKPGIGGDPQFLENRVTADLVHMYKSGDANTVKIRHRSNKHA